jgi:hypothetical protein
MAVAIKKSFTDIINKYNDNATKYFLYLCTLKKLNFFIY